jgi:hypothetical protein
MGVLLISALFGVRCPSFPEIAWYDWRKTMDILFRFWLLSVVLGNRLGNLRTMDTVLGR